MESIKSQQDTVESLPSAEELFALLDLLREAGFSIGVREYAMAQEILLKYHNSTDSTIRLKTWLAPLLCTRAEEQESFYHRFDEWNSGLSRSLEQRRFSPATPKAPPSELKNIVERSRPWRWFALGIVLLALGQLLTWRVREDNTQSAQINAGAPFQVPEVVSTTSPVDPSPAIETPDVSSSFFVIYGRVVDPDGDAVPKAILTIEAGQPTEVLNIIESDDTGAFSLDLDAAETDALIHVAHPQFDSPPPYPLTGLDRIPLVVEMVPKHTQLSRLLSWKPVQVSLILMPLISFGCWWGWRFSRRRVILERRQSRGIEEIEDIPMPEPEHSLFRNEAFVRARIGMLRQRATGLGDLNADATVEATLKKGYFSTVYQPMRMKPLYLVLVDRKNFRDVWAEMVDALIDTLERGDLEIDRYYFEVDPRICAPADLKKPRVSLEKLATLHHDHRLLVFSDGNCLLDPVSEQPAKWLGLLSLWTERALLTPVPPYCWSSCEQKLHASGLAILPASTLGLLLFTEKLHFSVSTSRLPNEWSPPYPEMLRDRPNRWTERTQPFSSELQELFQELQAFLLQDSYRWLCALAVYPEIKWHLLLHLGIELRNRETSILSEDALLNLMRLPWLRHGSMPDWLRLQLIQDLSENDERTIRAFLGELLQNPLESPSGDFRLDFAKPQEERSLIRLFSDLVRTEPGEGPLQDYVFIGFLLGKRKSNLQVLAPKSWHRWVYDRGMRALGLGSVPSGLLALAFSILGATAGPMVDRFHSALDPRRSSQILPQGLTSEEGESWKQVIDSRIRLMVKRNELNELDEAAASWQHLKDEENALAEEFNGQLIDFITSQDLYEGQDLTEIQRAAFDMKAEEDVLVAQEYIDRAGNYQKAIDIFTTSLLADPGNTIILEAKAKAEELRFMTEERFDQVKKGMSEDEVRKALGTPQPVNVREYEDRGVTAWFYPKAERKAAAGVYFKEQRGALKVYNIDFEAIKAEEEDESAS